MTTIDVMSSDITGRLFEAARIIGVTDEHRALLTEAGNTISSLRDLNLMKDAKNKDIRETISERVRTINELEVRIRTIQGHLEDAMQDKDVYRKLAEYMVDNQ